MDVRLIVIGAFIISSVALIPGAVLAGDGKVAYNNSSTDQVNSSASGSVSITAVSSTDNDPIPGATVRLYLENDYPDGPTIGTGDTDSEGRVTFTDLPVGTSEQESVDYVAEVSDVVYEFGIGDLSLYEPTQTSDSQTVPLTPTTFDISGTVVSESDDTITGANVELVNQNTGETVATQTTEAGGEYSFFDVYADEEYQVIATYRGETGYSRLIDGPVSNADIVITGLDTSGEITGDVIDQNFNPLSEATVELIDSETGSVLASTITGPEGSYTFTDIYTGDSYQLKATFEGDSGTASVTDLPSGTTNKNIIIENSVGEITGDVVNQNNNPLSGATVELIDSETGVVLDSISTGPEGSYVFTGVSAGRSYQLEATFEGNSGTASVTDIPSGTTYKDIVITGTVGEITGDVVDQNNNPLSEATVELINSETGSVLDSTSTGPEGSYAFTGVSTGSSYQLKATFEGNSGTASVSDLSSGTTNADIVVTEPVTGSIKGTVLSENGNLIPSADVLLVGPEERTTTSDSEGQFTFSDLPEGNYVIGAEYAGEETIPGVELSVSSGEISRDITIPGVQAPTGSIVGTTTSERGEEIADAEIRLINTDSGQTIKTTTSGPDGSYRFSGVYAGYDYYIEAIYNENKGSAEITNLPVRQVDRDITITGTEPTTATIFGSVVSSDYNPLTGANVVLKNQDGRRVATTTVDESADYEFTELQVGSEYSVEVYINNEREGVNSVNSLESGRTRVNFIIDVPEIYKYTNDDGIVTTNGLREAIDDWRTNEIGTDILRDVIDLWRSGEEVP